MDRTQAHVEEPHVAQHGKASPPSLIGEVLEHEKKVWGNVLSNKGSIPDYLEAGVEIAAVAGAAIYTRGRILDGRARAAEEAAAKLNRIDVERRYSDGMQLLRDHRLPQEWGYRGAAANPAIQKLAAAEQPDAIRGVGTFAARYAPTTIDRPLSWVHQYQAIDNQAYMIGQTMEPGSVKKLSDIWRGTGGGQTAIEHMRELAVSDSHGLKFETLKWQK